ncbi:hypothetical protein [Porphyrobacter sp. AAP82]|uniref:hypothetical protein n=1 Tax=Porphyrobacter sp. AAP82 TaxID=1248917 RepID=UPI0002EB68AA|nr:hypothetical protein [Porphyrobacter sp. AAP82]
MTRSPSPRSPRATALVPVRHDGWTVPRQVAFLEALAAGAAIAEAARQVGMSARSAYALRARLRGEPFDRAWHVATHCRFDQLLEAALERALNGVEVPHFHKGELVHTSRRYDERLTIALLARRNSMGGRGFANGHPASGYTREDFTRLLARVAQGPETWDEEIEADYVAREEAREARRRAMIEGGAEKSFDAKDY